MSSIKRFVILFAALLILSGTILTYAQEEKKEELPEKQFKIIKEYPRTPSKSQGRTGTCWCFSTTSFLETEAVRKGAPQFELSEMFTVHHIYQEKAKAYVRLHGKNNFAQGALYHDTLWVLKHYGMVRDSDMDGLWDYEEGHNHSELGRVLRGYVDGVISGGRRGGGPTPKWLGGVVAVLDHYFGKPPEKIVVDGQEMTPKEFADNVLKLNADDYVTLTSFSHMPFYQQVELLVPDNWSHNDEFYNLPLDELMACVKHALTNGYTAVYGGDTSEKTYSRDRNYVFWREEKVITQDERQEMWDNWSTTDDHAMHIVGIAEDEEGKTYYLIKDSGGPDRWDNGHFYMSENYVRAKADAILFNKESIPEEIRGKLNIK